MTVGVGVAAGMSARRGPGFAIGVAIGAAVPLLFAVASFVAGSGSSTAPPSTPDAAAGGVSSDRAALTAYEGALEPLIDEGAGVVVYGMRPGVADIAEGRFEDDVLVTMASGWVGSMEQLREKFAAVSPPSFLTEAADRFDAALEGYVETASALLQAARATGEERATAIEEISALGQRADRLFDEAQAMLDEERARLAHE